MANEQQLAILRAGAPGWNLWRRANPSISIDLSEADLREKDLSGANLSEVDLHNATLSRAKLGMSARFDKARLSGANLFGAQLFQTNLREADLREAILSRAELAAADLSGSDMREAILRETDLSSAKLVRANISGANLTRANLYHANLSGVCLRQAQLNGAALIGTDLSGADLSNADLSETICSGTKFVQATLTGCRIYGIASWDVSLDGAVQQALCITPSHLPEITVDHLDVAQFIYLLLNNRNIRHVIDTITSKVVLILGRFTPERKVVLEALRDELRRRKYLPIVFDFEKPSSRDLTETVSTLAHMARFVIADLTEAKSIPQELSAIVPNLPSVAVQPLIQSGDTEYAMFERWQRYPWVLETYRYPNLEDLLSGLKTSVIDPAERRANELAPRT